MIDPVPSEVTGAFEPALLGPFLALMPDAAVVVDGGGQIVCVNEQAEILFGYPSEDLAGRPIEVLVPERFRHKHRGDRAAYAADPKTRPMGAGLELTGRRRDGTELAVDISLAPLSGGDRPLVVAAVRDATARRAASAASAQLAAIVRSSGDGIIAMSPQGQITTWNPGAEQLFGYTTDEVVGRHVSFLVPEGSSDDFEALLAAADDGVPAPARDTRWTRKDGTVLDVALSVSPLHDPGGRSLGFCALLRDITQRKAAESQLRQLLADERRRQREQTTTADIRLALLSGATLAENLQLICRRACDLVGAAGAAVVIGDVDGLIFGEGAGGIDLRRGQPVATDSLTGLAVADGQPRHRTSPDAAGLDAGVRLAGADADGPALAVPIVSDQGPRGALVVLRRPGDPDYTAPDRGGAEILADQAALALELGHARDSRERLLLIEDRERIARDLHDLVIQRLFAAGMSLQSVVRLADGKVRDRIATTVDDLDATIREIRTTIFALEPGPAATGLRSDIIDLAGQAAAGLGHQPAVRFDGPVDTRVPRQVAAHVAATVREALSNISRHAHATHTEIDLAVTEEVLLVITDDGVGIGPMTRRSGLANLAERAHSLGGTFTTTTPPAGGTRLEWRVPLPP